MQVNNLYAMDSSTVTDSNDGGGKLLAYNVWATLAQPCLQMVF